MASKVKVSVVPAPTSGLNLKDNLVQLQPTEATVMKNVYPDDGYCRMLGPYREVYYSADDADSLWGNTPVKGVFIPLTDDVFLNLFWINNKVKGGHYTFSTGVLLDADPDGVFDVWGDDPMVNCHTIFSNKAFAITLGMPTITTYTPRISYYDETAGKWVASGFTFVGTTLLKYLCSYRSRLYAAGGREIQYGAVDAITGAMAKFDLDRIFTTKGDITGIGSATKVSTNVDQQLFVIANASGEVLVYQGDYPGSTTWGLVNRYFVGTTGESCFSYLGADLHIASSQGITPVAALLANQKVNEEYVTVSDKINPVIKNAFQTTMESAMGYGYRPEIQVIHLPQRQAVMLSIRYRALRPGEAWPAKDNRFFIMNFNTKAWGEIYLSEDIAETFYPTRWVEIGGRLFCLATKKLWEVDILSSDPVGYAGPADLIHLAPEIKTAHTYLDDPVNMKSIKQVRALLSAIQLRPAAVSPTNLDFNWEVGTIRDFFSRVSMSSVRFTAGHDSEIHNGNWAGLADMGRAISFYYGDILPQAGGEWNQPLLIKLFALEVQFETGSVM